MAHDNVVKNLRIKVFLSEIMMLVRELIPRTLCYPLSVGVEVCPMDVIWLGTLSRADNLFCSSTRSS